MKYLKKYKLFESYFKEIDIFHHLQISFTPK